MSGGNVDNSPPAHHGCVGCGTRIDIENKGTEYVCSTCLGRCSAEAKERAIMLTGKLMNKRKILVVIFLITVLTLLAITINSVMHWGILGLFMFLLIIPNALILNIVSKKVDDGTGHDDLVKLIKQELESGLAQGKVT